MTQPYVERIEITLVRSDGVTETLEAVPEDGGKLSPRVSLDFEEERNFGINVFAQHQPIRYSRERHVRIQLENFRGTLTARRDPPLAA